VAISEKYFKELPERAINVSGVAVFHAIFVC